MTVAEKKRYDKLRQDERAAQDELHAAGKRIKDLETALKHALKIQPEMKRINAALYSKGFERALRREIETSVQKEQREYAQEIATDRRNTARRNLTFANDVRDLLAYLDLTVGQVSVGRAHPNIIRLRNSYDEFVGSSGW